MRDRRFFSAIECEKCSYICNVTDMGTPLRVCPICSTEVPTDTPMVAAQVYRRKSRRHSYAPRRREPICTSCASTAFPESADGTVSAIHDGVDHDAVPCEACGLLVLIRPDKRRKVTACSDRCRLSRYKTRSVPTSVTCDVCGNAFEARAGAHYCSAACRQKAYRDRSRA